MRYRAGENTTVGNNLNPEIYTIRTPRPNGSGGKTDFIKNTHARKAKDNISEYVDYKDRATYSQVCSLCGAWKGSLGLEPTFDLYIKHLIQIFDECKRILRDDGCLFVNIGDTYANGTRDNGNGYDSTRWEKSKEGQNCKGWHIQPNRQLKNYQSKCLCDIPFRFSIAMIDKGWIKRNTLIWHKTNCMPASAKDRFTVDFEYVFMFVKQGKYYFEQQFEPHKHPEFIDADKYGTMGESNKFSSAEGNRSMIYGTKWSPKERAYNPQGRNRRCVWSIPTKPFSEAHFATFPETLIEPMIKAGCPEGGLVMDPFMGAGTVAVVAKKLGRHWLGSELNPEYVDIANKRIEAEKTQLGLF